MHLIQKCKGKTPDAMRVAGVWCSQILRQSAQDGLDNPRNIPVLLVQQRAFSKRQITVAPLGMETTQPNAPARA